MNEETIPTVEETLYHLMRAIKYLDHVINSMTASYDFSQATNAKIQRKLQARSLVIDATLIVRDSL